jgi:hypothetical protein
LIVFAVDAGVSIVWRGGLKAAQLTLGLYALTVELTIVDVMFHIDFTTMMHGRASYQAY